MPETQQKTDSNQVGRGNRENPTQGLGHGAAQGLYSMIGTIASQAHEVPELHINVYQLYVMNLPTARLMAKDGAELYKILSGAVEFLYSAMHPAFNRGGLPAELEAMYPTPTEEQKKKYDEISERKSSCGLVKVQIKSTAAGGVSSGGMMTCLVNATNAFFNERKLEGANPYDPAKTNFSWDKDVPDITVPVEELRLGLEVANNNAYAKANCQLNNVLSEILCLFYDLGFASPYDTIKFDRREVKPEQFEQDRQRKYVGPAAREQRIYDKADAEKQKRLKAKAEEDLEHMVPTPEEVVRVG